MNIKRVVAAIAIFLGMYLVVRVLVLQLLPSSDQHADVSSSISERVVATISPTKQLGSLPATVTSLTTEPPTNTTEPPTTPAKPIIITQGFGSIGVLSYVALVIKNPSDTLGLIDIRGTVGVYDANGKLLGSTTILFPDLALGQQLGISNLLDGSITQNPSRIDVQITSARWQKDISKPLFTADNISFQDKPVQTHVVAMIHNPNNKEYSNLIVSYIGYAADGSIISCGAAVVDPPPSSAVPVTITGYRWNEGIPIDRVEVYPYFQEMVTGVHPL